MTRSRTTAHPRTRPRCASLHLDGRLAAAIARARGRTEEHLPSAGQRDLTRVRPGRAAARAPAEHRDDITRFHRDVLLPAGAVQHAWLIAFELPRDDFA